MTSPIRALKERQPLTGQLAFSAYPAIPSPYNDAFEITGKDTWPRRTMTVAVWFYLALPSGSTSSPAKVVTVVQCMATDTDRTVPCLLLYPSKKMFSQPFAHVGSRRVLAVL